MTRRLGIIFIVYFSCQLLVMLFIYESLTTAWLRAFFSVSTSVMLPFGFSLLFLKEPPSTLNNARKAFLVIAVALIAAGLISRLLLLPAVSLEIVTGVLWYCFAYAPLELKVKYEKWKPFSNNRYEIALLSSINFVGINALLLGLLFKIMHWRGSYLLLCIGLLFGLVSIILWNYKFKKEIVLRKQAEEQIKEAYTEITDSISYAKRIQAAKLPKLENVNALLPQNFILYKPKDVVSGDFYYCRKKDKEVVIAAADCTGHGVPGALMSMIGSEKLDIALLQGSGPSGILSHLNREMKRSLQQTGSVDSTRDGMDIALCVINTETRQVQYAGANRPLWLIRNSSKEIEETKATKKAIGGLTEDEQLFETHNFQLQPGDTLYLFSDGYADTFGGQNGKKLSTKRFRELLFSIQDKTMQEQGLYLDNFITTWSAQTAQVDDILVIGIKL